MPAFNMNEQASALFNVRGSRVFNTDPVLVYVYPAIFPTAGRYCFTLQIIGNELRPDNTNVRQLLVSLHAYNSGPLGGGVVLPQWVISDDHPLDAALWKGGGFGTNGEVIQGMISLEADIPVGASVALRIIPRDANGTNMPDGGLMAGDMLRPAEPSVGAQFIAAHALIRR